MDVNELNKINVWPRHVIHQAKPNSSVSLQDYVEIEVMFELCFLVG